MLANAGVGVIRQAGAATRATSGRSNARRRATHLARFTCFTGTKVLKKQAADKEALAAVAAASSPAAPYAHVF
jgi:hypothetical protein